MDSSFRPQRSRKNTIFVIPVILIIALILGGVFYYSARTKKILSPLPEAPNFEVVFYTPVPKETTPTSTPSATPKGAKIEPSPTKKPIPKPTERDETPTKQSPSPTKEAEPTSSSDN